MSIKPFFIFFFILLSSSVYAIDYRLISAPPGCVGDITVDLNATMPIDPDEYNFLWCNNTSHTWTCPCDKPIVLSVQTNTINTYNILITYITETTSSSGSGGRSRHKYVLTQNNDTIQVKQNQYTKLPDNYTLPNLTIGSPLNFSNITQYNFTNIYNNTEDTPGIIVEPDAGIIETPDIPEVRKDGFFKRAWRWIKNILMYDIGGKK
jgi:hypothetical protein